MGKKEKQKGRGYEKTSADDWRDMGFYNAKEGPSGGQSKGSEGCPDVRVHEGLWCETKHHARPHNAFPALEQGRDSIKKSGRKGIDIPIADIRCGSKKERRGTIIALYKKDLLQFIAICAEVLGYEVRKGEENA